MDDEYFFISYKYNFKFSGRTPGTGGGSPGTDVTMLSDSQKRAQYFALRRSRDQKLVRKTSYMESQEMQHRVNGIESQLSDIISDSDGCWHGSTIGPKEMVRSEEEIATHIISLKPANRLSERDRARLGIGKNNDHEDVFFTKNFLQAIRHVQDNRTKYKSRSVIYLYQINDSPSNPCGLFKGGKWCTPGQGGIWKTSECVPVQRVIKIRLGVGGFINGDDCRITLIRDNGNMDTRMNECLNEKLNECSDQFVDGLYYDLDRDVTMTDTEQRFDEPDEQTLLQQRDARTKRDNQVATATNDIMRNASDGTLKLSDLGVDTRKLINKAKGRVLMRDAFRAAHQQWIEKDIILMQVYVDPNNHAEIDLMNSLKYNLCFDNRCFTKGLRDKEPAEEAPEEMPEEEQEIQKLGV